MNLAPSFMSDILADPEDDVPRLIYADWLEETGSPEDGQAERAEFIRRRSTIAPLVGLPRLHSLPLRLAQPRTRRPG